MVVEHTLDPQPPYTAEEPQDDEPQDDELVTQGQIDARSSDPFWHNNPIGF